MTRNCSLEAYRLQLANQKQGKVLYVARIGDTVIGHAYYVLDLSDLEEIALNQVDNGFPQFPALTVKQVLDNNDSKYLRITSD